MASSGFSPFDLAPGKTIDDRYRIEKPNRQSGLSATFGATDLKDDSSCELMVFPSAMFEGPAQAEEYMAAMEPWKQIGSPSVLKIRDLFSVGTANVVLVTDFPLGSQLRGWLKENSRMEASAAVDLGLLLLDGLVEIHGRGLVHGDIKPQTIFVDVSKSKVAGLLVDGGITPSLWNAKHLGEHTALIGTPFYAPVEQFGGDSPDEQSDVYNIATVLFEMIAGVLPWPGKSLPEVFQAKLDKHPPSMKGRAPDVEVESAVADAISRGLLADRRERYATSLEFREALSSAAG